MRTAEPRTEPDRYSGVRRRPLCSADDLQRLLTDLARRYDVPGAQLAAWQDGETIVVQTGVENVESRRSMRLSSKVPVGSITKAFTATMVLMLVADDDLGLDQPVSELLRGGGLLDTLTPRLLLSHTGGLPSDPGEQAKSWLRELDEAELVCRPGTAFSYSNVGYALAGQLVEAVTGMSWREAVEAILLRPLDIEPAFVDSAGIASGHTGAASGIRAVGQVLPPSLDPAGGLASSAADLVAFGRVHLGKPGLLDVVTAADMHRPVEAAQPYGLADGWGLGLALFTGEDGIWLGHDGTADGSSCHLRIDQAGAYVIALTTNAVAGSRLWKSLVAELRGLDIPIPDYRARPDGARAVPLPGGCFGSYRNGTIEYTIEPGDDGVARLVVDGDVFPELTLYDCGAFTVRDPATGRATDCGRFRLDERGRVTGIQVGGRLATCR
jgi:CubicO group peptidase (beta-lactamase class C family)